MQRIYDWYRDNAGNAISGATVSVYLAGTNTLASIYESDSNDTPTSGKANPFTTDTNGYWCFAAPVGDYDIHIEGAGNPDVIIQRVNLFDSTASAGASTPDASGVTYTHSGTGAVTRTVYSKFEDQLVSIKDFGGVGDNTTDNTAALNLANAYCLANNKSFILFPEGNYRFKSKPNNFAQGVSLIGAGIVQTVLYRDYTPGSATEGLFTWVGGGSTNGGGCRDLAILAVNTSGAAIALTATAGVRPSGLTFSNLNITQNTGSDTWAYNVYLDGSLYTTAGSQGIRSVFFDNCIMFAATTENVRISNGVHVFFNSVGCFNAGGSVGTIHVTGGGTATSNSTTCFFSNCEVVGTGLILDNCDSIVFRGYIAGTTGLSIAATALNCTVDSIVASGGITNSSATSYVYDISSIVPASGGSFSIKGPTAILYDNAQLNIGNGVGQTISNLNGASGSYREFRISTNGTNTTASRWRIAGNNVAESGANAGTNFELQARDDSGNSIDTPIAITRASGGTMTFGGTSNRTLLSNGDLKVNTAGKGLFVKEGSNAKMGTATLVAGASTVSTTAVSATSRIFVTSNADGGTPGWLRVSARVAGTSFTITSSSGTDTSTVAWIIIDPA